MGVVDNAPSEKSTFGVWTPKNPGVGAGGIGWVLVWIWGLGIISCYYYYISWCIGWVWGIGWGWGICWGWGWGWEWGEVGVGEGW